MRTPSLSRDRTLPKTRSTPRKSAFLTRDDRIVFMRETLDAIREALESLADAIAEADILNHWPGVPEDIKDSACETLRDVHLVAVTGIKDYLIKRHVEMNRPVHPDSTPEKPNKGPTKKPPGMKC